MAISRSASKGLLTTLQNAGAATAAGVAVAIPATFTQHRLTIKASAGVASGAIQPETSDEFAYAGTWAPVGGGPITVPAASSEVVYNFFGIFRFIRARISTIVAGGTVTVTYEGS